MNNRKSRALLLGWVLSVSLIAAAVTAWLVSCHYSKTTFDLVNAVCGQVIGEEPGAWKIVSAALKECAQGGPDGHLQTDILSSLGYRVSDLPGLGSGQIFFSAAAGWVVGAALFLSTVFYLKKAETRRIEELAAYLERVNNGKASILSVSGEDDFAKLEDEIYKTVTALYQAKDQAVEAKDRFAQNLSNIAHQIKTPITAISLACQRMKGDAAPGALGQVKKQLARLTYLEEALLLISRLDAGTLVFQKEKTDVYTLLVLASDNLQELFSISHTSVEIPELGEMWILADMDWTMEAVMNLMKNCMEHGKGESVHCSYAQNPLYTQILICDNGPGFAKEDLPHLFERFYRGQNAEEGGIGIGLALAKEIVERQNGTIRAKNAPEGGAVFEIRFYSH